MLTEVWTPRSSWGVVGVGDSESDEPVELLWQPERKASEWCNTVTNVKVDVENRVRYQQKLFYKMILAMP